MPIGEKIPDVDEGSTGEVNSNGLTAQEQAEFDSMRTGEPMPEAGDNDSGGADDGGDDGGDDAGGDDDTGGDGDGDGAGDGDGGAADRDATGKDAAGKDGTKPGDDTGRKPRTINYNKHERETKKLRDQLEASTRANATLAERQARLDERTKILLEAINGQAKPAAKEEPAPDPKKDDPEPDENEDPIAHASWTRRELGRTQQRLDNLEKGITTERTTRAVESEEQALERTYVQDVEATASADPNFTPAYEFLRESRYRELGFTFSGLDINDPEQVKQLTPEAQAQLRDQIVTTFNQEQLWVAKSAYGRKQSAAKSIYNLAIARGFDPAKAVKPAAAEATDGGTKELVPSAAKPNGSGKAPAAKPAPRSAAQELQDIRDGIDASKSLSDAGGSPGSPLTAESIVNMTDEDFAEFYNKMPKAKLDMLMGK